MGGSLPLGESDIYRGPGPGRPARPSRRTRARGSASWPFLPTMPVGRIKCSREATRDRKSTRLNSSHSQISYAVFCLKKKKKKINKNLIEKYTNESKLG